MKGLIWVDSQQKMEINTLKQKRGEIEDSVQQLKQQLMGNQIF